MSGTSIGIKIFVKKPGKKILVKVKIPRNVIKFEFYFELYLDFEISEKIIGFIIICVPFVFSVSKQIFEQKSRFYQNIIETSL